MNMNEEQQRRLRELHAALSRPPQTMMGKLATFAVGASVVVLACNTASAVALEALASQFDPVPVQGVVEPGAAAACQATRTEICARILGNSTTGGVAPRRERH